MGHLQPQKTSFPNNPQRRPKIKIMLDGRKRVNIRQIQHIPLQRRPHPPDRQLQQHLPHGGPRRQHERPVLTQLQEVNSGEIDNQGTQHVEDGLQRQNSGNRFQS